ncbi:hypothetical protein E2C01_089868 [Portunus trituberculatus]|uniref:Uncharacterized protein n=1 Tax=Portunus trituberculatus TaxID=210409 RepID=A0A5B7JNL4_PORTR|nr:hypothetical protein [Portunus trituberculatus]
MNIANTHCNIEHSEVAANTYNMPARSGRSEGVNYTPLIGTSDEAIMLLSPRQVLTPSVPPLFIQRDVQMHH